MGGGGAGQRAVGGSERKQELNKKSNREMLGLGVP